VRWDWVAGPLTMVATILLALGYIWPGWIVSCFAQVPWWLMIRQTRQWGLVPMQVTYTVMSVYAAWRWRF